ncbi:MAG: ABC transporter permease [Gammaproteobacteria bacterium]|nr:ABC transporter permease [Gammaproteobacteria bacterium]MYL12626.1 ABC transporter permease [Gammaproteobacteria bacterium]
MYEIFHLLKKDLLLIVREPSNVIMLLMLPLLIATIFGSINNQQGGSGEMPIAVVDGDKSQISTDYIDRLDARDEIAAVTMSLEAAMDSMRIGQRVAYMVISPGFGSGIEQFPFAGSSPVVDIVTDPRRPEAKGILTGAAFSTAVQQIEARMEQDEAIGLQYRFEPISVTTNDFETDINAPATAFEITIPQAALWSILTCVAMMSTSLSLERMQHTLLRIRISPTSIWKLLTSKVLSCMIAISFGISVVFLFGVLVFGITLHSVTYLFTAVLSAAFCFAGLMLAIGSFGRNPGAVAGMAWTIMLLFAMIGGGMIPYFLMPEWMEAISSVSPGKWTILALEGAVWRDFSFGELFWPCFILVSVGLIGTTIGVLRLNREHAL